MVTFNNGKCLQDEQERGEEAHVNHSDNIEPSELINPAGRTPVRGRCLRRIRERVDESILIMV